MGASEGALTALDADIGLPDGDFQRHVPLLVLRRPRGIAAVIGHLGDRQVVTFAGNDLRRHLVHEGRGIPGHRG